jgi:tight adherence protein B
MAYVIRVYALKPQEARVKALSAARDVQVEPSSEGVALLRRGPSNAIISRVLNRNAVSERWQMDLDRAGLNLRPTEYFLVRLVAAAITVLVIAALGRSALAFFVGVPIGVLVYMLPPIWVRQRIKSRVNAIEHQLAETISLIASSLRAGFAFAQGVDAAAKRMGPPIASELQRMMLDINLGMSTEDALAAMNERVNSEDLDMVVTAILIQRNSGGNLAEVLENVTETMRDRERIRGEIKTLTSAQRFTGWVLAVWPVLVFLVFFALNPGMMSLMWTTTAGIVMLGLWAVLNLLGGVTLSRILSIDI